MDNSNNNGLEYDDNSDMSDKKPHRKGFRNGFGVGIATGIVTTIVLGLIVLFAYTMITGRSVPLQKAQMCLTTRPCRKSMSLRTT